MKKKKKKNPGIWGVKRLALALAAGVLGVDCTIGEGRIYTGLGEDAADSGLFLGWVMAIGFKFMGIG